MKNSKVARIMDNANRHREVSDYEINNRRKYINLTIKRIKEIVKQYSITDKEQLRNIVLNNLAKEIQQYCLIANIQGRYFQIEAAEAIIADKSIVEKQYVIVKNDDKYAEENDDGHIYTASFILSCRTLIGETLRVLRMIEQSMTPEIRKAMQEYNKLSEKDRKKLEQKLKHSYDMDIFRILAKTINGTEVDKIYEIIKTIIVRQKSELKEEQIKTMEYIFEKFQEYDLLGRYKKDNDRNMINCGLDEYTYELSTGKYSKNEIGIEEVFSREFLETQDLEDIIMLSTFWQNRYSKECKDIGEAIFAIDTLDLWKQIVNGKEDIRVSDIDIEGLYNKIQCVSAICESLLNNLKGKHKDRTEEEREIGYKIVSDEEEIEKIVQQEGERYEQLFAGELPTSPNDLGEDIRTYKVILNQVENIYLIRNSILGCKIRSLINSKHCKNWGIILEEDQVQPEQYSSNYVLIGIDQEGFNMPERYHIKKDLLISFLKSYNKETKIPIYEGNRDFIINGKHLPTNILMPSQARLKKVLRTPSENDEQARLKSHLVFISDSDKYPEHLKETIHTSKGIKKVRPPKRYIDLETGQIFEMENGKYVTIQDGTGGNKGDGR